MHYLVEEKRLEFVARTRFFINLGCWSNSTASLCFKDESVKISLIILFLIPLFCEGKATPLISKQNAVYESTFSYFIKDATKEINISNSTKVDWFYAEKPKSENFVEFDSINDEKILISKTLINNLIEVNSIESAINWKPILVSAVFDSFEKNNQSKTKVPYYQVSKVAFSKGNTKALVNFTYKCTLCGSSSLIYLELINNRWVVKGARLLWVS